MTFIFFGIIGALIEAPWWYWLIYANCFVVRFFHVCDDDDE